MKNIQEITSRYVLPTVEEKTAYGYKRQDPYTKLFEERIIFLGQPIDDTVANDVMAQLLTLESMDPDRDIMIYIDSLLDSLTLTFSSPLTFFSTFTLSLYTYLYIYFFISRHLLLSFDRLFIITRLLFILLRGLHLSIESFIHLSRGLFI